MTHSDIAFKVLWSVKTSQGSEGASEWATAVAIEYVDDLGAEAQGHVQSNKPSSCLECHSAALSFFKSHRTATNPTHAHKLSQDTRTSGFMRHFASSVIVLMRP